MRANEFVANKIYQESKLFEDELSDFFQIEEIRVEGEKKFRLKFGPDDTEGELFDTRREAQKAKREQIKLARQAGNSNKKFTIRKMIKWPLETLGNALKWSTWATIITILQGSASIKQALDTFEAYHEFLRTTDICDKEYKIRNLTRPQRKLVQDYVTDVANEITDGITTTLALALTGATMLTHAGKLMAIVPGPGWVGALALTVGGPLFIYVLERFLEHNGTLKALRKWITTSFVNPMFTDSRYIKRVCDDRLPNWEVLPIVKNIPGVNESQSIDANEAEAELMSIWDEIAKDPKIQKYIQEWERNNITP
jgi:hypothetical protein